MATIKTFNSLDKSGGHCHGRCPPVSTPNYRVRVNGYLVMLCGQSVYSPASCGDNTHARNTAPYGIHSRVRINGTVVFTSDDLIQCGEPAGQGIFPVFVN